MYYAHANAPHTSARQQIYSTRTAARGHLQLCPLGVLQTVFQGNTRHQENTQAHLTPLRTQPEQRSDAEQGYFGLPNVLKPNANE